MLTIGASDSSATARHFSSGTMSLRFVEYSRIRPQPVHVKLHVCNGSSCSTIANLGVRRSLCLMIWPAIFADRASGNRIWGLLGLGDQLDGLVCRPGARGRRRRGIGLKQAWQEEVERRNTFRGINAAAARTQQQK